MHRRIGNCVSALLVFSSHSFVLIFLFLFYFFLFFFFLLNKAQAINTFVLHLICKLIYQKIFEYGFYESIRHRYFSFRIFLDSCLTWYFSIVETKSKYSKSVLKEIRRAIGKGLIFDCTIYRLNYTCIVSNIKFDINVNRYLIIKIYGFIYRRSFIIIHEQCRHC